MAGLIMTKSNTQMNEEQALEEAKEKLSIQQDADLNTLVGYVIRCWDEAKRAKDPINDQMELALLQRNGEYSPSKLTRIRMYGGSEVFMRMTDEKSTACKAWLGEIMVQEQPWSIEPTPIPELPPDITDEIRAQVEQSIAADQQMGLSPEHIEQRVRQIELEVQEKTYKLARQEEQVIEQRIKDILKDGNWDKAFKQVLDDVVDLHAGILKGPIIKQKPQLYWKKEVDGTFSPDVKDKFTIEFKRVSPFDIYPSPTSTDVYDGYLIERHRLTRSALIELKGVPGYNEKNIEKVLTESMSGSSTSWLDDRTTISGISYEKEQDDIHWTPDVSGTIDALQFWGKISGAKLKEFGVKGIKKPTKEYEAEVWVINKTVIKAEINGDPLGRRPYYKASFRERNGAFWGVGLPETISDIQDMCNASARNLVNNMAYASGPQVGVDISRLAEGESPTGMAPNKVWQFDETMNVSSGGRPPLWFFQPQVIVGELLRVYTFFSEEADNKTGIPKYSYGSGGSSGALGTATGMSMMMSNASRGIKQVVSNIDVGIVQEAIQRLYEWFMLYDPQTNLPGDLKIIAKGSSALIAKEQQQVRRNEFLNIAMQPPVMEIIGRKGLAEILRGITKGLDFGSADIIPSSSAIEQKDMKDQMMQQAMQQMQMAPPQAAPAQTMPDGAKAGGVDANAFPNLPQS